MSTAAPISREARLEEIIIEITELDAERANLNKRVQVEGFTRELSRLLTDLQGRWNKTLETYAALKAGR